MVKRTYNITHTNHENSLENVDIEEAVDKTGHGRYNYILLVGCCIIQIGGVMEMLGYGLVVPAASCDLKLTSDQAKILKSINFAGFIFAIPWGYIADTRGRRLVILVSAAVGFVFSTVASFSNSYYVMLAIKFLASSFSTAAMTLTPTFLGESTCRKQRATYLFILNLSSLTAEAFCFILAYLILSLDFEIAIPFLINYNSWRLLSFVLSVPLGIGAVILYFLQESPKFLADKGRTEMGIKVLRIIFNKNYGDIGMYPVKSLAKTNMLLETMSFWDSVVKHTVPIFRPPLLWRTLQLTFLLCICSFTNNIFFVWFPTMVNSFLTSVSKDISFCQKITTDVTPYKHDIVCLDSRFMNIIFSGMILTLVFTIFDIAVLIAAFYVFKNWRRSFTITSFFLAGISCIVVDMVNDSAGNTILYVMVQLTGLCFASINSYYITMYPTSNRGLAASVGVMVARFICLGGVDLVGAIIFDYCRITFYCWATILFGGIVAAIFLPEDNKKATSVED